MNDQQSGPPEAASATSAALKNSANAEHKPTLEQDTAFEDALRARLETLRAEITPAERQRLDAARRRAVASASSLGTRGGAVLTARALQRPRWLSGAAVAALALVAVLAMPRPITSDLEPLPLLDGVDISAAADLELLENLELLTWLDGQLGESGAPDAG